MSIKDQLYQILFTWFPILLGSLDSLPEPLGVDVQGQSYEYSLFYKAKA